MTLPLIERNIPTLVLGEIFYLSNDRSLLDNMVIRYETILHVKQVAKKTLRDLPTYLSKINIMGQLSLILV